MMSTDLDAAQYRYPIYGHVTGQGPGVLFIHGWNHSRKIWEKVTSELRGDVTSVAVDLPGFGNSPRLPAQDITIPRISSLVAETIASTRNILGLKNIPLHTIVADSLGAIYILELIGAERSGERPGSDVDLVFSLDSMNGPLSRCLEGLKQSEALFEGISSLVLSGCPSDGLPSYVASVKNLEVVRAGLKTANKLPRWASKKIVRVLSLGTVHRYRDISDELVESVLQSDPATSQLLFKAMANYAAEIDAVSHPKGLDICVVRGEKDRIVSEDSSRRLADKIDGKYIEIKGVSHTPMIESPGEYASIVRSATKEA